MAVGGALFLACCEKSHFMQAEQVAGSVAKAVPMDSQQQAIAQPNIASSAGSPAAVETSAHEILGSNQSASLAAAIAEGTVVQESSQPILSGLEVTDTEALINNDISAAQAPSIQEVVVSEAPPAREVVASESPLTSVSGEVFVSTEQSASVSEASASDTAVAKALTSDAAPAVALVSESAGPVVQISDEPILTESQPAALVQAEQAFSHDPAAVSSTELTDKSAEHISLSQTQTPAASSIPAAVGITEAAALSEDPILDPAADDVNTVHFPVQQTVADSAAQTVLETSAQHVLETSAQQQTGLAELQLASDTQNTVLPGVTAPQMQPQLTVTEQPVLTPPHSIPQVTSQVVLTEQHRFTSAACSAQLSSQAVVTDQPPMTAILQRPPVPALPSKLRRSRSDLPIGQQLSSGSLISQQSLAQMESQAGMRRSVSNIQAVSPQPAVQTGLSQSLAYMPATMQTVDIRQTASPLKAAVPAIPAIPMAPAKPLPVQPVQVVSRTTQQTQPTVVQTAVVQQPLSASIDSRELMMQGPAPKGPVFMRSYGSSAALRPQTPLAVIQEQAPQLPVSTQQTVFVASAPQQMAPYPVALGSPPSQPPQFMRTAAVPASVSFQPMTSTVTVDTQGPLSKGVQESWNSLPTSVLQQQQQPPPLTVPQTASSWHQGTLHAPVVASPSQHFTPLSVSYDSLHTPVLPRVATPVINTARSFQQSTTHTMQTPAMYDMQQATYAVQPHIPSTSMAYAVSQGPLRQSMPLAPPQQPSVASKQYVQSPGTVIQPMSSTTIVGPPHQETQRLAQSGAGFSIVPLHQAGQQQGLQQQSLQQQIMAKPALARSQTGGIHASRALQAFSRSRSSFGSGEVPLGDGYLVQQGVSAACCPSSPDAV